MIVTFVSECHGKSIHITRRVLDMYAQRIGRRTWQTNLTQQGLAAVRDRLTRTARRSTAVACHRPSNRRQTELVWIVGNRRHFDSIGRVPIHRTRLNQSRYRDGGWDHLPLLDALVQMAALWHDFGKASKTFQETLRSNTSKDSLRHEWLSLLLFHAFVGQRTDTAWLADLLEIDSWHDDRNRQQRWIEDTIGLIRENKTMGAASPEPLVRWMSWLIVSHHLLPSFDNQDARAGWLGDRRPDWDSIAGSVTCQHGYLKGDRQANIAMIRSTIEFPTGLPTESLAWRERVKGVAGDLARERNRDLDRRFTEPGRSERLLLTLARVSLIRGDHAASSIDANPDWKTSLDVYANTAKRPGLRSPANPAKRQPGMRQYLDEHLDAVASHASAMTRGLSHFDDGLPGLIVPSALRKRSAKPFTWQNLAVDEIRVMRSKAAANSNANGCLVLNWAGTGTGKTLANAKIMAALSPDQMRVSFALGLRTLTLQTGDEYRTRLGLDRNDLEVLIGSKAVAQLHDQREDKIDEHWSLGQDTDEGDEEYTFEPSFLSDAQDEVVQRLFIDTDHRRFLTPPFLVSTIDHLIPAVDGTRGGRHILPTLRLMSSDLVIDEIDDYDVGDLPAVMRLIHLTAMLGRNVLVSSATLPPAIASAAFLAYSSGWSQHAGLHRARAEVDVLWVDEFHAKSGSHRDLKMFEEQHHGLAHRKVKELDRSRPIRRTGRVFAIACPFGDADAGESTVQSREDTWLRHMAAAAAEAHGDHHDAQTHPGRRVSVGLIRLANVSPCVAMGRHLLNCDLPPGFDIRVVVYHAAQVLLLRSQTEAYLDRVLNRKASEPWGDAVIEQHLSQTDATDVLFIVVASPVAEVGRDHDYDWAIVEPSSMRSIIQIAGRVRRHRHTPPNPGTIDRRAPNIHIADRNHRAFVKGEDPPRTCPKILGWGIGTTNSPPSMDQLSVLCRRCLLPQY